MPQIQVVSKQVTPQLNGFYLIEISCDFPNLSTKTEHETISWLLAHQLTLNGESVALFDVSSVTKTQLDLKVLSNIELTDATHLQFELEFDDHQDIFEESLMTPELMIFATDLRLANAFCIAKYRKNQGLITEVLLHSTSNFPFMIKPARMLWSDMPSQAIGASVLLEDWGVRNRLASLEFIPGTAEMDTQSFLQYWQSSNRSKRSYVTLTDSKSMLTKIEQD